MSRDTHLILFSNTHGYHNHVDMKLIGQDRLASIEKIKCPSTEKETADSALLIKLYGLLLLQQPVICRTTDWYNGNAIGTDVEQFDQTLQISSSDRSSGKAYKLKPSSRVAYRCHQYDKGDTQFTEIPKIHDIVVVSADVEIVIAALRLGFEIPDFKHVHVVFLNQSEINATAILNNAIPREMRASKLATLYQIRPDYQEEPDVKTIHTIMDIEPKNPIVMLWDNDFVVPRNMIPQLDFQEFHLKLRTSPSLDYPFLTTV